MHGAGSFSGFVLIWSKLLSAENGNHGDALSKHLEVSLPLMSAPHASCSHSNKDGGLLRAEGPFLFLCPVPQRTGLFKCLPNDEWISEKIPSPRVMIASFGS